MKILDFPELRQISEFDCGANALQSVLAYYGIEINEEEILKEAKTSQKGTSVQNIESVAKKHGLKFDSRKMTIADVKKYIDEKAPVILLVQAWSENKKTDWQKDWKDGHYVVAIGYDKTKIYFEDPYAFERTFLTFDELILRWHDAVANKQYINHGIAVYGKNPKFDSKKIIHMN